MPRTRLTVTSLEPRTNPEGDMLGPGGELTAGHIDFVEVELEPATADGPAELGLLVHDEERDMEFTADGTSFVLSPAHLTTRPAGSAFAFLGATDAEVWLIPQVEDPALLFGGVAAEEIDEADLAVNPQDDPRATGQEKFIRVDLVSATGPTGGTFAVWANDPFGTPVFQVRSDDGVNATGTPADAFFVLPGGHIDYNWAFTTPGTYELTFQASAKLPANGGGTTDIETDETTFTFVVRDAEEQLGPGGELTAGHVDFVEVELEPGEVGSPPELALLVHDEERDEEFSAAGTSFVLTPDHKTLRPAATAFNFLGKASADVWLIPQIQDPRLLFGGVAAEEIDAADLALNPITDSRLRAGTDKLIRVDLVEASGPDGGTFAAWSNDSFGQPVFWLRGDDGVNRTGTATDSFFVLPGGHIDYNWAFTTPGTYRLTFRASAKAPADGGATIDLVSEDETFTFVVQDGQPGGPRPAVPTNSLVVSPDSGGEPTVRLLDPLTGTVVREIAVYESTFTGGVRATVGDVTGDGVPDVVTGAGIGGGPAVKLYDGQSGKEALAFFPYEDSFRGGVYVSLGDVDGDGRMDIVTGTGVGGGPRVRVFALDGTTPRPIKDFFAYEDSFRGGVQVAAGDVDGDGVADVVTGTGVGGGPRVRVLSGKTDAQLFDFFAYESTFRNGVQVAAADLDGDRLADVVVGSGPGGGPRVRAISGATNRPLTDFFAYDASFRGGVLVGVIDANGDDVYEIVTGAGVGDVPMVRRFDDTGTKLAETNDALDDTAFRGGVQVSGTVRVAEFEG